MTIDFSTLEHNPFRICFDLRNAFAVQALKKPGRYGFIRVALKGQFDQLFDYACGVYWLQVETVHNWEVKPDVDSHCCLFTVGCGDDGLWQAWGKYVTYAEAKSMVDNVRINLLDDLYEMPTAADLNDKLRPLGLYGEYTG